MERYGAFGRLSVIELEGSAAGAYCAKMFADLGATVMTGRQRNVSSPGAGGLRFDRSFYDASKTECAQNDLAERIALADVVIQSSGHDRLAEPVHPASDRQVVLRIAPFAAVGPYADWRSSDLVNSAIAGHLRLTGDPEREPLQGVADLAIHAAGVMGFNAAVAALIAKVRTGRGQLVEVSHQEVLVALHQFTLGRYTHNGAILNRLGNRYAGPGSPIGGYECADGWIGLALPQDDQVERMLEVTGLITMLERPDVESIWDIMTKPGLLDEELIPYLKTQPRDETVELFQALRLPCAPIAELDEVLEDPHLADRGFWRTEPLHGRAVPGPPFTMSAHDWSLGPKRSMGTLPDGDASPTTLSRGPLTGIRVIDMTRVWAGPLAARLLADLGAEVVMTEVPWTRTPREVADTYVEATHFFPEDEPGERPWNRSCFHNKYGINKLSTVIELDKPEGRELFTSLLPQADVLIENYSPRVMPGFGFDDDALRAINPALIYVTMPGYGRSGPHTDWVAYGPTIDGHVGLTSLSGYENEGPWKSGIAWPDPIGGMHGAAAALVALLDRFADPETAGQSIEVAQIEAAINMIGQHVTAVQSTGRWPRTGNRRPGIAPQGVYPCRGKDRWVAISVIDDKSWRGLCRVIGAGDLVGLSAAEREAAHDEIDARIAVHTVGAEDHAIIAALQAEGVPAGPVADAADVMADRQLAAADFFASLDHPDAGSHPWPRFPATLSLTPPHMTDAAPTMGQHNEYVVRDLAGYSDAQMAALADAGIIRTEPPH